MAAAIDTAALKAAVEFEIDRRKASASLYEFVRQAWHVVEPGAEFVPSWHIQVICEHLEAITSGEIRKLLINIPPRHALRLGTPIPTTTGMVAVENIQPGDMVFAPDGTPTKVLGVSDVFKDRPIYRVTTDDGASLDVDGDHLWTVRLERKKGVYHTYTTEQLWHRQNGVFLRTKRGGGSELRYDRLCSEVRNPRLPDAQAVQYPERELPIDPYVLGVWLGDGTSANGTITMHDDDIPHVRAEMQRRGWSVRPTNAKFRHLVAGLHTLLRQNNLLNNKHIPDEYLTASVDQRRALLKGLMDTDGNVSKKGQCFFAQSNRELIDRVAQLIRSLGIKASIIETNAAIYDKQYGKSWNVSFYASDIAALPRKEERTLKDARTFGRYIRLEKLDEVADTKCIKVDRDDGLFIAGDGYIVTHNSKSTIVNVMWPTWEWIADPSHQYLTASFASTLSVRDNLKARRLIQSPWYQERWGHLYQLSGDQNAKQRFENDHMGHRIATSVGGATTGDGGSRLICLHPDTLIQCNSGTHRIQDLVDGEMGAKVLGFNHETGAAEYQGILKFEKSAGRESFELETAGGLSVTATHDHPVYVIGSGYINLSKVKVNDRVLRYLPEGNITEAVSSVEMRNEHMQQGLCERGETSQCECGVLRGVQVSNQEVTRAYRSKHESDLLQPQVSRGVDEGASCGGWERSSAKKLLGMWSGYLEGAKDKEKNGQSVLLEGVPVSGLQGASTKVKHPRHKRMQSMRRFFFWSASHNGKSSHLFSKVWRRIAQLASIWRRKREIHTRAESGEVSACLSSCERDRTPERWECVLPMWDACGRSHAEGQGDCVARSPHRLRQEQQRLGQFDNPMHVLPRDYAWRQDKQGSVVIDIVKSVKQVKAPEFVYNVAIENTHNYFANGILLHNCDDPHGAQEAQSDAMREAALEWFDASWSTRLNNPKTDAMVVVMQRLHELDVSGHILNDLSGWEHICIPAEWDGVKRKTFLGPYDPRTAKGQLICPERFGPAEVANLKQILGSYGASGQLQQDPTPAEGGILKTKHFKLWPHDETLPPFMYILQSYDCAFTERSTGDPTACTVWGVFNHKGQRNVMLIDAWDEHLGYPDLRQKVINDWRIEYGGGGKTMHKGRRPDRLLIEAKASGQSLLQDLRLAKVPAVGYNPGNADKVARAHQAAPTLELGLVWVPESRKTPGLPCTWAETFMKQVAKFPVAAHDDFVDTFTQAIIYLKNESWFELPEAKDIDEPRQYKKPFANPYAV